MHTAAAGCSLCVVMMCAHVLHQLQQYSECCNTAYVVGCCRRPALLLVPCRRLGDDWPCPYGFVGCFGGQAVTLGTVWPTGHLHAEVSMSQGGSDGGGCAWGLAGPV